MTTSASDDYRPFWPRPVQRSIDALVDSVTPCSTLLLERDYAERAEKPTSTTLCDALLGSGYLALLSTGSPLLVGAIASAGIAKAVTLYTAVQDYSAKR